MRPRQRASAEPGIIPERRVLHIGAEQRQTGILQLADIAVQIVAGILCPAQEHVADRLHHPLSCDHPLALVRVGARPGKGREHGLLRFLDLQQQGVAVRRGQQGEGAERADAAHAHHLERDVLQPIALKQHATVFLQSGL